MGNMSARGSKQFYICACYYTENYFIQKHNIHVRYIDKEQFNSDYRQVLKKIDENDWNQCIDQLEKEKNRRQRVHMSSEERRVYIAQHYKPLHPHAYQLSKSGSDDCFHPRFLQLVQHCRNLPSDATVNDMTGLLKQERADRVVSFPVFTPEFCAHFIEEIENFERSDMPKGRPNTMNNYGVLLSELDFTTNFLTRLREDYLTPITSRLYPDCGGACLDSHRAFIVKYSEGEDLHLDYHYDNAEVTINVCLGRDFTEGELYFGDVASSENVGSPPVGMTPEYSGYSHEVGRGLLHRGLHRHGALPITGGTRYNLIIWMRASPVRNLQCPMCWSEPPELVAVSAGWGYGFTRD